MFNYCIAALLILYFFYTIPHVSRLSDFQLIWLFMGGIWLTFAILCTCSQKGLIRLPMVMIILYYAAWLLLASLLLLILLPVYQSARKAPDPGAAYIIILGAHIYGSLLSESLRQRLDQAVSYYKKNPHVSMILSGARGSGEDITEAQAMYDYLQKQGIPVSALIKEESSTDTNENIYYSLKLMSSPEALTVIATSNFHVHRALLIARKQGLKSVQGLSAPIRRGMLPCYALREALALVYYKIKGRI